ncbi:MAG: hypothetical protein Q7U68_04250 [Candidatus Roizmanbacteria bacterium]|jgi:hypothetical protein|nr:hypothetical protein [Candidatus Roizmanbacteria bacterium]
MELTKVARGIEPAEYILSILPPQDRLEIIFKIAQEVFKQTKLRVEDIDAAVKKIRRERYKSEKKAAGRS